MQLIERWARLGFTARGREIGDEFIDWWAGIDSTDEISDEFIRRRVEIAELVTDLRRVTIGFDGI